MSFYNWKPYVSAAERKRKAEQKLLKMNKAGAELQPVRIEGQKIATTFWGKAWCQNMERYSDFDSRLPRGRTYVRNGSVLDLRIEPGKVAAMVSGSDLYQVQIALQPVEDARWKAICKDCSGSIDSLVELLQGKLSTAVMERICRPGTGLFPAPAELKFSCSCPDWADMCKHVAAVFYGIGARLDEQPELLFLLRQVNEKELIAKAAALPVPAPGKAARNVLVNDDLSALFGLEMETAPAHTEPVSKATRMGKGEQQASVPKAKRTARKAPARKKVPAKGATPKGRSALAPKKNAVSTARKGRKASTRTAKKKTKPVKAGWAEVVITDPLGLAGRAKVVVLPGAVQVGRSPRKPIAAKVASVSGKRKN